MSILRFLFRQSRFPVYTYVDSSKTLVEKILLQAVVKAITKFDKVSDSLKVSIAKERISSNFQNKDRLYTTTPILKPMPF